MVFSARYSWKKPTLSTSQEMIADIAQQRTHMVFKVMTAAMTPPSTKSLTPKLKAMAPIKTTVKALARGT